MKTDAAPIWQAPLPTGWERELETMAASVPRAKVFFRADDIAIVDDRFEQLMNLFRQYLVPLNLAVVPVWMDRHRLAALERFGLADPLWCWHQHGFSHRNHEVQGRKCEFGPARSRKAIQEDLEQGRETLEKLFGPAFTPVFTPPWNRCTAITLELLPTLGFRAVSRFLHARPASPHLPDLAPNVDLHTRKQADPVQDWTDLCRQIRNGLESGTLGFMLHHNRMNERAFRFLDRLLPVFASHSLCRFREMAMDAPEVKEKFGQRIDTHPP